MASVTKKYIKGGYRYGTFKGIKKKFYREEEKLEEKSK